MTTAYFEDHPTDPDKVILRKPTMMWEGSLHIVCECDKCKAQSEQKPMHPQLKAMLEEYFDKCFAESAPQRKWKNLRSSTINKIFCQTYRDGIKDGGQSFARAIEAAHGITVAQTLEIVDPRKLEEAMIDAGFDFIAEALNKAENTIGRLGPPDA